MGQHLSTSLQQQQSSGLQKEQVLVICQNLREMLKMRLLQFSMAEFAILKRDPLLYQSEQISFKCPSEVFLQRSKVMFGHEYTEWFKYALWQSPLENYQYCPDLENEIREELKNLLSLKLELTTEQSELTFFQSKVWEDLQDWENYRPDLYKQISLSHPYCFEYMRDQLQVEFEKVVQQCDQFVLLESVVIASQN